MTNSKTTTSSPLHNRLANVNGSNDQNEMMVNEIPAGNQTS
jgi:hypothetical protein